jgi:hypothetical protein
MYTLENTFLFFFILLLSINEDQLKPDFRAIYITVFLYAHKQNFGYFLFMFVWQ